MTPKPDVVIVHGAFHPPDLYSALKTKLEELGHTVVIPRLATLGESPGKTWKDDVAVIHEAVLPLFEQGHEVIIASHSYGGIPAAQAIEGFDVGSRSKQGKQGGFRAAVLMAAFAVPAGTDLYEATGKQYMSSVSWVEPYSGVSSLPAHPPPGASQTLTLKLVRVGSGGLWTAAWSSSSTTSRRRTQTATSGYWSRIPRMRLRPRRLLVPPRFPSVKLLSSARKTPASCRLTRPSWRRRCRA